MLIGESEIPDCPANGGYCYDIAKSAYVPLYVADASSEIHPGMVSGMPYISPHAYGHSEGYHLVQNNVFKHFTASTRGGQKNTVIKMAGHMTDYSQTQYFTGNTFLNVSQSSFAHVPSPK